MSDPELSAVAGILDARGGIRVVITEPWRMCFHVARGERLFVVHGLRVREPVGWSDVPQLIETVKSYVERMK